MKIVCEACQAKYSISDDKVRGKAFKIRCKKCSHIIVVRGTGDGASSSPIPETVSGVEAAWHIVVDGEQVGPLSESDIRARLSRGEINGDTYIWKEGLADWLKISAVPDFAGAATGGAADAAYSPQPTTGGFAGGGDQAFASAFSQPQQDEEQDVFAAATVVAPPGTSQDLFGAAAAAPSSAAAQSSSSFSFGGSSQQYAAAEPAPRSGGNGASHGGGGGGRLETLTGQRHENSVLFSLSNLEALAAPAPAPAAKIPSSSSGSNTEGSGLIDIRSMAAMTLNNSGGATDSRPSSDLPAFAAPQFSPVAPVLLPMGATSGPPKWVYPVVGLMAVIMILLAVGIFAVIRQPAAQVPSQGPAMAAAPAAATAAAAPAPAPVEEKKAAAPAATPPPADDEPLPPREEKPVAAKAADKKGGGKASAPSKKGAKASEPERPAAAVVTAPPKAEPSKPKDSIDSLLEHAMGTKKAPTARNDDDEPAPKKAASATLPPLQREDIVKAMTGVNGKVKDCYNQFKVPGTAMVNVTVADGGKISSVSSSGKFAGTPTGGCVESAVRGARFPQVKGLNFPWSFSLR